MCVCVWGGGGGGICVYFMYWPISWHNLRKYVQGCIDESGLSIYGEIICKKFSYLGSGLLIPCLSIRMATVLPWEPQTMLSR